MDDTNFFSTETITVPIGFRLLAIGQLSLSQTIGKIFGEVGPGLYSAKWDQGLKVRSLFIHMWHAHSWVCYLYKPSTLML